MFKRIAAKLMPVSSRQATSGLLNTVTLMVFIAYVSNSSYQENAFVEAGVSLLLYILMIAIVYFSLAFVVLLYREKRRDITAADNVELVPDGSDYRAVDYSSLSVSRSSTLPAVWLIIGLTIFSFGSIALFVSLTVSLVEVHGQTGAMVLVILTALMLVTGLFLTIFGWKVNRKNSTRKGDFDKYIADNGFRVDRDKAYLEGRGSFYRSIIESIQYSRIKVGRLDYEVTGIYRGRQYNSALIKTTRLNLMRTSRIPYVGITTYPFTGDYLAKVKLQDALQHHGGMYDDIIVADEQVVFISLGLSQDRASMMRQFQYFDQIIEIDTQTSSSVRPLHNGAESQQYV